MGCVRDLLFALVVALGVGVFAAAEAAGRALSYDEATTEVRAWLNRPGAG